MAKRERTKGKKTHRSSVRKEMIAHDIRIMGHGTLSSKAVKSISINRPKEIWRVNGLTDNRLFLL